MAMPDLVTHVLVGFVLATVLSWYDGRVTAPFVTVAMAGAIAPDLNRIALLLPEVVVTTMFEIPWSWTPFHRAGGTLLVVAVTAALVGPDHRRLAFAVLAVGAASHYALDVLLYRPSGLTRPLLWPFLDRRFAVDGFLVSTDRWPAAVASLLAFVVWLFDRRFDPAAIVDRLGR